MAFINFLKVTRNRLFSLLRFNEKFSLLRVLQYEQFIQISLSGLVLDFGGGKDAKYQHLSSAWQSNCTIQAANIDLSNQPDFLLKNEFEQLPVENGHFDNIVSLNTLEHVYRIDEWLVELARVLKPSGKFIFTVPYMFYTHGHPSDYNRFTPEGWRRRLEKSGFTDIQITALYWGPFSTRQAAFGQIGPFRFFRKKFGYVLDYLYFLAKRQTGEGISRINQDEFPANVALAFHIECKKNPLGR